MHHHACVMGRLIFLAKLVFLVSFSSVRPSQPSCPATNDGYDADVLIRRAGMAGITAAKTLHEAGVNNILILEARDRIGGRMRSENFGGIRVEIGANWIQSVDKSNSGKYHTNPIWELAQRCGIKGNFSDYYRSIVVYDGSSQVTRATNEAQYYYFAANEQLMRVCRERKSAGLRDISVRQALAQQGWNASASPVHRFVDWFNFDYGMGEDVETTSLFHTHPEPSMKRFGENDFFVTDDSGFEHLVHCLASDFNLTDSSTDSRLRLNTTVTDIYWSDACVCVKAINGRETTGNTLCARHAIFTFSIGVLKNTKGIPFFHPALPKYKTKAIGKIDMTHMLKIYVKFNHSFWDRVEFIGQVQGKYPILQPVESLHGKFPLPHDTGVLIVSVMGKEADRVLHQPVEETKQQIVQQLRVMYGNNIPEPEDILVPTWKKDPLYMGTYSNTPVGVGGETYRQLAAPLGNLYFSGEATSEKFHSFVHGAYIAAINTAQELVHQLKHPPKTDHQTQ